MKIGGSEPKQEANGNTKNDSRSNSDSDSDTPLDSPSKPSGMKLPAMNLGGNKPMGMKLPMGMNSKPKEEPKEESNHSESDSDSDTPLDSPSKPTGMKLPAMNLGGNKPMGMKLPPMKIGSDNEEDPTKVQSISKTPKSNQDEEEEEDDEETGDIESPSRYKPPTLAMGFKLNMGNVTQIDDNQFELGPTQSTYKPPSPEKKVEFQLSPHQDLDSPTNYNSPHTSRESDIDDEKKYSKDHREALTQRNVFIYRHKVEKEELDNESMYLREISMRKMYYDPNLHIEMLALLMGLLITPKDTLDQKYTDDYPVQRGMLNIPYYLHQHINHPDNQEIIPKLHSEVVKIGRGARILFRLVCKKMFQTNIYSNKIKRIGVGGFGTVWQCKLPFSHSNLDTVAAKMVEVPKDVHSRCVVHDVFTEILVMDLFKGDPRICRMYDYGVDDDQYYIIMKEYRTSLRTWREKQTTPLSQLLPLYMRIFYKVLESIQFLCDHNVNHFDLKCDNVFLEPYDGVSDKDFWKNTSEDPNFKLVLGDFGTAHLFATETDAYTTRNRGTDCIKSPEMLKIELLKSTNKNYDRRKRVGANSASDMWSLGCLFFELLTTEFLFNTPNFFLVVTNDKFKLISQERYQMLGYNPILMDILTFILVRDPERRPNIEDIISRFRYYMTLVPLYEEMKKKGKFEGINSPKVTARIEFKSESETISDTTEILLTPQTSQGDQSEALIPYCWSKEETDFYSLHYSEIIKSKLYLSGDSIALDKKMLDKLGITHIVICSENPPAYKECFFYYEFKLNTSELPTDKDSFQEYENAFSFVRTAIATRGKVLVYSGKGLSRSALFCVSYLLHTYNLSSYEAYLYVHNLRPAVRPEILYSFLNYLKDANFVQTPIHDYSSMLDTNDKVKKWISRVGGIDTKKFNIRKALQWYRCLCGACLIGVVSPYHHSSTISKMGYSLVNILKDLWPSFLEEMKAVYFYEASSVKYAITTKDRCFLDEFGLSENCEKYVRKSSAKKKFTNSEWVLYRCKYCQWATHAVREKVTKVKSKEKPTRDLPQLDEVDIAVISNLLTNLHCTIEDKVEDKRPASLLSHF
jgi:protein-tyrosine phosphatase